MDRYIMGKNCVREVMRQAPERIKKLFVQKNQDPFPNSGIKPVFKDKEALSKMVLSDSHQGVVALVQERPFLQLKDFLKRERETSLVLLLDSIFDPHNLGAILRAAECFGVDAVVWSKNRGVDLTPAVSKVSVGASELVDMIKVSNLAETVKQFQKAGYSALGADTGEGSVSLFGFHFPDLCLLVLGSEGKGIQRLIKNNLDQLISIPMQGRIDSLNVSQAAAVFLAAWQTRFP